MATTTAPDVTPPTLLCLHPDERRKILLESLREGYPGIPKVSRPVSSKVSRYVSQFTSGRWRERIWFSDDSTEDMQCETSTPESEAPTRLVIFGYDLHCDDYLKEREMIARWNIVERELHFPNLETGYAQKRDAKTQSEVGVLQSCQTPTTQDANTVQEPTEDIQMEECQESPQKVTEDTETLLKLSGQESSIGVEELGSEVEKLHDGAEVVKQTSSCSVQESEPLAMDSKALGEIPSSTQPGSVNINSESSAPLEDKEPEEKMATVLEDSKVVGDSGMEMKTPEAISPAETNHGKTSVADSEDSVISKESEERKEVSTVHDSKLTKTSKMETIESTLTESGDEISVPKLKFLAALEIKEPTNKVEAGTVLEDSNVSTSEKAMETTETTSTQSSSEKVSVPNSESSGVPEEKEPADKMEDEAVSESSKVSRTSETDVETSGTTLRGKRKADSISEDDPDEKRTKKTSAE